MSLNIDHDKNEEDFLNSLLLLKDVVVNIGNKRKDQDLEIFFNNDFVNAVEYYKLKAKLLVNNYQATNLFKFPVSGGMFGSNTLSIIQKILNIIDVIEQFVEEKKRDQQKFIKLNNKLYFEIKNLSVVIAKKIIKMQENKQISAVPPKSILSKVSKYNSVMPSLNQNVREDMFEKTRRDERGAVKLVIPNQITKEEYEGFYREDIRAAINRCANEILQGGKKAVLKKPVAKKPVAKKPVAKKPAAKKPAAKKPAAKKSMAKKSGEKKPRK